MNSLGRNAPNKNIEKTFSGDNLYHKKKINDPIDINNNINSNINNNNKNIIPTGHSSIAHKLKSSFSNFCKDGATSPQNKEQLIRISEFKMENPQNKNDNKHSLNNSKDLINRLKNQASSLKTSITNKNPVNNNSNKITECFQFEEKENISINKHIQNELSHCHLVKGINILNKHETFEIDQKKYIYGDKNKFNKNSCFFNDKNNNSNNLSNKNFNNKDSEIIRKIKNLKTFHPTKYNENNKKSITIKVNKDNIDNNKNINSNIPNNVETINNINENNESVIKEKEKNKIILKSNNINKSKDKIKYKERNNKLLSKDKKTDKSEKDNKNKHNKKLSEENIEKNNEKNNEKNEKSKIINNQNNQNNNNNNIENKENDKEIKNKKNENLKDNDKEIVDKVDMVDTLPEKEIIKGKNNISHKNKNNYKENEKSNDKEKNNKEPIDNVENKLNPVKTVEKIIEPEEKIIYFDISNINNVQIPKEYINIIYYNLLKEENIELNPKPIHTYMKNQKEINDQMRSILIDWIIDVHHKFGFTDETLFMTVLIIDRFCSIEQVTRIKYQCLGITALMIACKHEEINVPKVEDFIYITDNAYTKDEVFKMENDVLSKLNFSLLYPSPIKFYEYLSLHFNFSKQYHMLGKYLMESFLLDLKYIKYKPSIISCACTYIVMKFFKMPNYRQSYDKKFYLIDEKAHSISNGYGVKDCAQDICVFVDNINNTNLLSCQKKYTKPEFESVSTLITNNNKS